MKFAQLPEVRIFLEPESELDGRLVRNLTAFLGTHLSTKGTRHAEDQNVHNALLVALVDGEMLKDRLISAVAKLLGVRWEAVKCARLPHLPYLGGTAIFGRGCHLWEALPYKEQTVGLHCSCPICPSGTRCSGG